MRSYCCTTRTDRYRIASTTTTRNARAARVTTSSMRVLRARRGPPAWHRRDGVVGASSGLERLDDGGEAVEADEADGVPRSSGRSSGVRAVQVLAAERRRCRPAPSGAWTTPVVPTGTGTPTVPAGGFMRRDRAAPMAIDAHDDRRR